MQYRFFSIHMLCICGIVLMSCNRYKSEETINIHDTIVVHDTVVAEGTFTYNLPCKVVNIHPEQSGKAMLVFWLHGGVRDQKLHNFLQYENHMTYISAVKFISSYLQLYQKKAVILIPICHKANIPYCVRWIDCADDIKHMIDDYVRNGIVDENKVFLMGVSDGGSGTWDLISEHGDWFAAAMPMSCSTANMTSVPVYWHSTSEEGDQTLQANSYNAKGCNITYEYHPNAKHGGDEEACDKEHLDKFFSNVRMSK